MKRLRVRHRDLRALLSEFLPYELPTGMSNKYLYRFMIKIGARFDEAGLRYRDSAEANAVIRIILGTRVSPISLIDQGRRYMRIAAGSLSQKTVPYRFRVAHGQDGFRELSIPHMGGQIALSNFYEKYGDLVTYFGNRSTFSVRRPVAISRVTVVRDDIFEKRRSPVSQSVETVSSETEIVRSFFVYDKHAGINALFDSREFLESEQSFSYMLRVDIAKCFESIYTHSIEWSVYGRSVVKSRKSAFDRTMPREFDKLMMAVKEEETNGLLIGPEVSRIFAEIVLQGVDQNIERDLKAHGITFGDGYSLFRYVDDYYLFYNDTDVARLFRRVLDARLHEYGLHINESKTLQVRTPHLTPLSVAKARVREASSRLKLRVTRTQDVEGEGRVSIEAPGPKQLGSLISSYKMALTESRVAPEDLANYALVLVEEEMEVGISRLLQIEAGSISIGEAAKLYDRVCDYLGVVLEYSFYVFAGSGRASAAVKTARIASLAVRAVSELRLPADRVEHVKQVIFEEARRVMRRYPLQRSASLESLYMLDVVSSLGAGYRLNIDELLRFSGATRDGTSILLPEWMHSMAAMTLLRNIGGIVALAELESAITSWALDHIKWMLAQETDHAERAILVLDLLSSPHVPRAMKVALLDLHHVKGFGVDKVEEAFASGWFTSWSIEDLHAELLLKRSQHVY